MDVSKLDENSQALYQHLKEDVAVLMREYLEVPGFQELLAAMIESFMEQPYLQHVPALVSTAAMLGLYVARQQERLISMNNKAVS